MEDFDEGKPIKVEKEWGINRAEELNNTFDNINVMPNRVDDDQHALIKIEFDSNSDDDRDKNVLEDTSKEQNRSSICETKGGRMSRLRNRMIQNHSRLDSRSKLKRSLVKTSYCEDTSDNENYLTSTNKKCPTKVLESKTSKEPSKKTGDGKFLSAEQLPVLVIKLEPLSGEELLSKWSEELKKSKNVPVKESTLSKTRVVKKKSTDTTELKEMTFEEVCKIFRTKYRKNFYRSNPNIKAACENACKKYLVYRCRHCLSDFDDIDYAKNHFEKQHASSDPRRTDKFGEEERDKLLFLEYFDKFYKCVECALTRPHLRDFVKHMDSFHNKDKQELYSCDTCNSFTTFDKYRFTSHMKNHNCPTEKKECPLCHLSFVNIKVHLQNMHSAEEKIIKCPQCSETFGNVRKMRRHQKNKHAEQGTNFVCKDCGKVCKNGSAFRRHIRIHYQTEARFQCQQCGAKLKTKTSLKMHMRRHSEGVQLKVLRYSCVDCGKSFGANTTLLKHIRREHDPTCEGPEKKHMCKTCGKSFELKAFLDRHMVVHTKEKKFVCATCNKGFTQMDSLKSHQVVHTGIKPFVCGKCGKKYTQKFPLTQHIKKHHPDA